MFMRHSRRKEGLLHSEYIRRTKISSGHLTGEYVAFRRELDWERSPRVNGRLVLKTNPHKRYVATMGSLYPILDSYVAEMRISPQGGIFQPEIAKHLRPLRAQAYSKFRGKLYEGNAALGVTAASYRQSANMIRARYNQLNKSAEKVFIDIQGLALEKRGNAKRAASSYLEYLFGWSPLVSDIHAAATSVIQKADQRTFVRGTAEGHFEERGSSIDPWGNGWIDSYSGILRVSQSAAVTITNPNLWLAERAGLLNPAAIAWDLVPWSFVANMFSNIGGIVNSITDYSGLTFEEPCTTTICRNVWNGSYVREHNGVRGVTTGRSTGFVNHKIQTVGIIPSPPLVFKLPDVSWETAAMAASLFTQKLGRITTLVRSFRN